MIEDSSTPDDQKAPLKVASSNFETRRVQSIDDNTLRIKPTMGSLAFSVGFIVLGLGLMGFWVARTFTDFQGPGSVPLLFVGVLFALTGLFMYRGSNTQLVINRATGIAFIRSWSPRVPLDAKSLYLHVQPQDIKAIQTVCRVVKHRSNRSKRGSTYTEYQVNLCASENDRHNLFVTLKADKAEKLARQLAQMFNVPLNDS